LREIQQHSFYSLLDWYKLEQRLIPPPHKPIVMSDRDTSNVDDFFTRQNVCLTPETPRTLSRIQQTEFEGFDYVNPLILSEELSV
jgi:atypical protein kinase C iota type